MSNHLEQTWIAYVFRRQVPADEVRLRLGRVENHYQPLYADPLLRHASVGDLDGMALWQRPNAHLRWPLWTEADRLAAAWTGPPTGWSGLLGDAPATDAPLSLARRLLDSPASALRLNPPFVACVRSSAERRMVVVNDVLGTGRLFEMQTPDGWVWSNRLGALPLFAGVAARADERAWRVLAATGWFTGETTALEGARQLRSGSVIEVDTRGGSPSVRYRRERDMLAELVAPRRATLRRGSRSAAEAAVRLARDVGAAWSCPLGVDLSGGRDSRVSASACVAAGIEAEYKTADLEFGELDVVRTLLADSPRPLRHRVEDAEADPPDDLAARLGALHLVHDGMRNPQAVLRAPMPLPHGAPSRPVISGHGGELGHGFYYEDRRQIRRLRRGGPDALLARLAKSARKVHGAAREEAYRDYLDEAEQTLEEGRSFGLRGPVLLDYYYLSQRLANRSGLGTRNERWSACSTPEFVRACFDLSPGQRLANKMHRLVISRLVPEWSRVPFFAGGEALAETKRTRIWDKPRHREQLAEIIAEDESWHDLFEPERIRGMWHEVARGGGHPHYEAAFTRVAWRAGFDDHLRLLTEEATAESAGASPPARLRDPV